MASIPSLASSAGESLGSWFRVKGPGEDGLGVTDRGLNPKLGQQRCDVDALIHQNLSRGVRIQKFISQNVLIKLFLQSQFTTKPVNLI